MRVVVAAALVGSLAGLNVAAGAVSRPAQQPIFASRTQTVRVDVSVRQNGRPVQGLSAADFEVLDNGVPQQIEFAGADQMPVSIVLALDVSGSVRGARLTQIRDAGSRLVQMLGPSETAAVVAFTDLVSVRLGFTDSKPALLQALHEESDGTDTALLDATHAALVLAGTRSSRPLVILFSDGADTASFLSEELVLNTARRTGAVVYAVASTVEDQSDYLDRLVGLTGGRRLEVASLDGLSDAFAEILSESRDRYLLSYTPTGVRAAGWHDVVVRLRNRRADVHARPGYLAGREQ